MINCTEIVVGPVLDLMDYSDILKNATFVHFDYSGIVQVTQFPHSKIKYLSLRHNKISIINDEAFGNLKFLVELDLSYNSLTAENLKHYVFKVSMCVCSSI